MKVLLITHPEMDHLEAMTFSGLTQLLGDDNVVTYPFKKSYYGITADDYILDDGKIGLTSPYEAIIPRNGKEKKIEEIKRQWEEFDIIIMATTRTHGKNAMRELKREIGNRWSQPLAILEGEDSDNIRWDLVKEFHPIVYFKREYKRNTKIEYPYSLGYWPPIIPCPFSAITERAPKIPMKKEYNLYSVHGNTNAMRISVSNILREMNIPKSIVWVDGPGWNESQAKRVGLLEYYTNIAKSRIGVSIRGHGVDTVRYWEVPMFDTLLFTHDVDQEHPQPFEDGKTCVKFKNDLTDIKEKLQYYLQDENECGRIAKNGYEHLHKYHTTKARASYIMEHILRLQ